MSIDGFEARGQAAAFNAFEPEMAERFYGAVDRVAKRFDIRVEGLKGMPRGRGLIGKPRLPMVFAMAAASAELKRLVWVLGEHLWWKVPFVRRVASGVGTVDGTPENASTAQLPCRSA